METVIMTRLLNWKKALFKDLPSEQPITQKSLQNVKKFSHRYRGSVRISNGLIWTDREVEESRKREYNHPLP